jgi:hypothetical protein
MAQKTLKTKLEEFCFAKGIDLDSVMVRYSISMINQYESELHTLLSEHIFSEKPKSLEEHEALRIIVENTNGLPYKAIYQKAGKQLYIGISSKRARVILKMVEKQFNLDNLLKYLDGHIINEKPKRTLSETEALKIITKDYNGFPYRAEYFDREGVITYTGITTEQCIKIKKIIERETSISVDEELIVEQKNSNLIEFETKILDGQFRLRNFSDPFYLNLMLKSEITEESSMIALDKLKGSNVTVTITVEDELGRIDEHTKQMDEILDGCGTCKYWYAIYIDEEARCNNSKSELNGKVTIAEDTCKERKPRS